MTVLFWLLVGHAVADYPLQGDFLARGKNHRAPLPGVPWWICLVNHAAMHAGMVALVTGSIALGLVEFVLHCVIDYAKCDGLFDRSAYWDVAVWGDAIAAEKEASDREAFTIDQALHVVCKVGFAIAVAVG